MLSIYIGVYKALYDYTAQADEELTLQVNDLLYLLEKSDIDDWWKVKKRVIASGDEVVDEPSGLVPSTYIEEAPVIKTATALYDYEKQTDEELSFRENEKFYIYDLNDPDWILVGDFKNKSLGLFLLTISHLMIQMHKFLKYRFNLKVNNNFKLLLNNKFLHNRSISQLL